MTDSREQELLDRIAELEAENASLRARIAKLEQQLIELSVSGPPSDDPPAPAFVKPKRQTRLGRLFYSWHSKPIRFKLASTCPVLRHMIFPLQKDACLTPA